MGGVMESFFTAIENHMGTVVLLFVGLWILVSELSEVKIKVTINDERPVSWMRRAVERAETGQK
jgi:putative Mn2+ efflux pump MntP